MSVYFDSNGTMEELFDESMDFSQIDLSRYDVNDNHPECSSKKEELFDGSIDFSQIDLSQFVIDDDLGYISNKDEWVCYKKNPKSRGSQIVICAPFLIAELNRFVPYLELTSKNYKNVKFHPLNMPHIKIGKIEIVGVVLDVKEETRFLTYFVDDGTGTTTVLLERRQYELDVQKRKEIDAKYKKYVQDIWNRKPKDDEDRAKRFPNPRPGFIYPPNTPLQAMADLEADWSPETNNGRLGTKIKRFDHIHAIGYCTLDYQFEKKPEMEITFAHLCRAKLNFLATKLTCVTENEYNSKLEMWIRNSIRNRYKA